MAAGCSRGRGTELKAALAPLSGEVAVLGSPDLAPTCRLGHGAPLGRGCSLDREGGLAQSCSLDLAAAAGWGASQHLPGSMHRVEALSRPGHGPGPPILGGFAQAQSTSL